MTIQDVEHRLMDYFLAVGGDRERYFSADDFAVLKKGKLTSEDRETLALALANLTANAIIARTSVTEWRLTPHGLTRLAATRESRRVAATVGCHTGSPAKKAAPWT